MVFAYINLNNRNVVVIAVVYSGVYLQRLKIELVRFIAFTNMPNDPIEFDCTRYFRRY